MNRKDAQTQMIYELERMQEDLSTTWLDQSLPEGWSGLDGDAPMDRHKIRVTLRLDADMVRWFRKLGPGYGPRINRILRIYWAGLIAGRIKGYPTDDVVPRLQAEALREVGVVMDEVNAVAAELRTLRKGSDGGRY